MWVSQECHSGDTCEALKSCCAVAKGQPARCKTPRLEDLQKRSRPSGVATESRQGSRRTCCRACQGEDGRRGGSASQSLPCAWRSDGLLTRPVRSTCPPSCHRCTAGHAMPLRTENEVSSELSRSLEERRSRRTAKSNLTDVGNDSADGRSEKL